MEQELNLDQQGPTLSPPGKILSDRSLVDVCIELSSTLAKRLDYLQQQVLLLQQVAYHNLSSQQQQPEGAPSRDSSKCSSHVCEVNQDDLHSLQSAVEKRVSRWVLSRFETVNEDVNHIHDSLRALADNFRNIEVRMDDAEIQARRFEQRVIADVNEMRDPDRRELRNEIRQLISEELDRIDMTERRRKANVQKVSNKEIEGTQLLQSIDVKSNHEDCRDHRSEESRQAVPHSSMSSHSIQHPYKLKCKLEGRPTHGETCQIDSNPLYTEPTGRVVGRSEKPNNDILEFDWDFQPKASDWRADEHFCDPTSTTDVPFSSQSQYCSTIQSSSQESLSNTSQPFHPTVANSMLSDGWTDVNCSMDLSNTVKTSATPEPINHSTPDPINQNIPHTANAGVRNSHSHPSKSNDGSEIKSSPVPRISNTSWARIAAGRSCPQKSPDILTHTITPLVTARRVAPISDEDGFTTVISRKSALAAKKKLQNGSVMRSNSLGSRGDGTSEKARRIRVILCGRSGGNYESCLKALGPLKLGSRKDLGCFVDQLGVALLEHPERSKILAELCSRPCDFVDKNSFDLEFFRPRVLNLWQTLHEQTITNWQTGYDVRLHGIIEFMVRLIEHFVFSDKLSIRVLKLVESDRTAARLRSLLELIKCGKNSTLSKMQPELWKSVMDTVKNICSDKSLQKGKEASIIQAIKAEAPNEMSL